VTLTGVSGAAGITLDPDAADRTATVTIADNDAATDPNTAIWAITGSSSVNEGAAASYTVSLAGTLQAGETANINLGFTDGTTTAADYASFTAAVTAAIADRLDLSFDGTKLTFTGTGSPMADLVISLGTTDDLVVEGPEAYTVALSAPGSSTGANVVGTGSVPTTIFDTNAAATTTDTATWSISGDPVAIEGGAASYTVSLAGTLQAGETANINLGLTDLDTTSADYASFAAAVTAAISSRNDLSFTGGSLTYIGDGNPMANLVIDLDAIDDDSAEVSEDYKIVLSTPGSTTGANTALAACRT
jgi:hypothetical protein